ncbi:MULTISPECIES: bifunctional protein-serine/threonine kinase/phosphatase [Pseudomonas]|jgi:serine/threonine protein phosphatase PrpC|uniref:Bifunctional protein-serine/threonine kinase/phosphatase n=2 Tax=Gammaproteobacteria TaxID=1236 RepID=A0ABT5NH23_9PSED|nr:MULTISPECIES: bifunctional protein-serine/threonine kinase/phosphatase [Pseudomonas]MDD0980307.1 bifunctional protein-serine/threonine kinase/phosphatase [Pseudomonas shahriarae]MDD0986738.1 bifunctional protein-serine/threonine kinase/phosphatase [Pseudomonas shahriarae]MDD1033935.1 bifunctional protein-serine/threonine kinase/phosphatase [Pseudomonas shahriarae]MDD1131967.1 bifunctional protein-serine/threonine kinase/phosphatase [Pseudomonas shahriarae]NMY85279.1 bifunctional protein-ser
MSLQLSVAQASAIGPRAENQDALRLVTPAPELAASKGYLCAIADGVSQCADGGLAARSTLQALALDYYATPQTWGVAQALDRLLLAQNRWLQANGGGQPLLTTLSALVFRGQRFTLAHVGDCRVYRWFAGELQRITEEHVWEQPGMQHVLKRALGLDQHLVVDFLDGELRQGECFLLLSDGVWATLADHSIRAILREQADLDLAVNTLVNAAHLAGSQDNASALLVRIDQLGAATLGDALVQLQQWPLPPPLKAGQAFEGWQVECVLAHSRQSLLYRVRDTQQQAWLLKTLAPGRDDDNDAAQALLAEEWFLRRVAGRAFPEVHPGGGRQHLYYVMREYSGQTLAELFQQQGPLPLAQWQSIAERLLRAVGMLHRRQILHRDIKPENLLLGEDGELRVLDFGLAYCPGLSEDRAHLLPGTPSFIAPEAFSGERPTPQQDLYSVGVSLYYLLTGHYPYGEIEAFQRPRFNTPVSASRYRPDLPDWLQQSLERSVAAQAAQRYETAEEWLLVLEQADRRELSLRPRPLLEREPLKVWQTLALVSLLINLLLLYLLSL